MFEIQPDLSWWLQPRLFIYFLAVSGVTMASIGFYIYSKLGDIYPYNFIASACLVEAAIYFRFMRMTVCPSQVYVFLAYYFPVFGASVNNIIIYKYFETVIVLFAAQIYGFALVNLTLQLFICIDFYQMLKNPFYPRQRRGRFQHFFQFTIFLSVMAMYLYVIYVQHVQEESGVLLYERMNITLFYTKIIMIVIGLIYIILTIKILFRKGTNQELRWIALNR